MTEFPTFIPDTFSTFSFKPTLTVGNYPTISMAMALLTQTEQGMDNDYGNVIIAVTLELHF